MAVNLNMHLIVVWSIISAIIGSGFMTGGYRNIDPSRDDVKEAANFAVDMYNKVSNDLHSYRGLKIVCAQSQVVNGINYKLRMEIGKTQCRKNHASGNGGIPSCDVNTSEVSKKYCCKFLVYKTPLLKNDPPHKSLEKYDCHHGQCEIPLGSSYKTCSID